MAHLARSTHTVRGWIAAQLWGQWNGNYFEYDGHHVRVLFEDDAIYVATLDVFAACRIQGHGRNLDRARYISGRDGLVSAPGTRLQCFTERGLRAWLERRTDPTCAKFASWFELQVVKPHQRRRDIYE